MTAIKACESKAEVWELAHVKAKTRELCRDVTDKKCYQELQEKSD